MAELEAQIVDTGAALKKFNEEKNSKKSIEAEQHLKRLRKQYEEAKHGVENYRKALDNLNGQSLNELIRMQKALKRELDRTKPDTEEWKRMAKEYQQVTERIDSLKKAQKGIVTEGQKSTNAFKTLFGKVNEFYGGLLVYAKAAKAAFQAIIGVTKQVVNASQTMGDKWNNGMAAMKTTTEAFFMALSTGDWSAFNDGLAGALKNARELAEQMDLLASYAISADYMRSEYLTSFQEHLNNARDTGLTEEERKAELAAAEKDLAAYNKTIKDMADETTESLIKEFKAVKGIDYTDNLEGFEAFFDELYKNVIVGGNNMVAEARKKLAELEHEYSQEGHWDTRITEKGMERVWVAIDKATAKTRALRDVTELYGEDVVNLARASELSDDALKSLLERHKQAKASEKESLTLERQLTRTRNSLYSTKPVDAYAESIKKIDKALEAQKLIWKRQYANGLIDKQLYEARIAEVEEDFLKQKMATAEKYGKDTDQFMSQLLDRQIARMDKAKAMLKEEMEEMARYQAGLDEADANRFGSSTGDNGIADQEAYDSFQEKIWQKAADIRAAITEDSARTEYETEVMWAQKLAEQKKITAEEAEKHILQAKLKYAQAAAQQVSQITEQASNFVAALKEAESAQMEAEYQKQLTAAGDNAEERERIEAEYEQKQLDLKKKYADTEMAVNIAKTIANGAVAAIKAYADAGPVAGAILAALIAATTAAEVATIIAQRNAIKNASVGSSGSSSSAPKTGERKITGYAEGGYTGKGLGTMGVTERPARPKKRGPSTGSGAAGSGDEEVVGVVHANEWVAPAWMVRQNPVVFANLEQYRQRGYAEGGYTGKGLGTMGVTERPARPPKRGPSTGSMDGGIETIVRVAVREELPSALKALRVVLVRRDLTELDAQTEKFEEQTSR